MRATLRGLAPLVVALFCASPPASAQEAGGNPANWCRDGAFASDSKEFRVARVRGVRASRAYFDGVYRKKK